MSGLMPEFQITRYELWLTIEVAVNEYDFTRDTILAPIYNNQVFFNNMD